MPKIGLYTPDDRRSILVFLVIILILFSFWGPLWPSFGGNKAVSQAWQTGNAKNREAIKDTDSTMKNFGNTMECTSMAQILAQGSGWHLEQAWSPDTRGSAVQFRDTAPYLMHVVAGRAVIDDYGIKQADGSWALASGAAVLAADGSVIAAPTKADILAQAHAAGSEWRTESLGFNPYANLPVQQIGIDIVNGNVADYTVRVTDQDGSFYVWARNLDRALALQAKQGTSLAFNLRNYEVDFVKLQQQVDSSDDRGRLFAMNDNKILGRAA
jgi:hypothetical protein